MPKISPKYRNFSSKNTFLHLYHFISLFDHTPTVPPPPQVYQSGLTIRGNSKKWTYDRKNVASVAYVVDNSQICIGRNNRTLTSVDAGGSRVWSLLGEDEMGRASTVGLGIADAMWGDDFYDWVEKEF